MERESKMLLDAMTQKLKWCGAPHFSQAAQERRKTDVKRTESREDENFWSSEMARNRESVCDHHRNPEPQACTEHSSHQETFERKERRGRAAESIHSGRPAVCRCHRDSPGQQMKEGPRRYKWACAEGWVCGPLSLREARLAS